MSSLLNTSAQLAAYALSEADMLRMDASILTVQLNIRFLLEASRKLFQCCSIFALTIKRRSG